MKNWLPEEKPLSKIRTKFIEIVYHSRVRNFLWPWHFDGAQNRPFPQF